MVENRRTSKRKRYDVKKLIRYKEVSSMSKNCKKLFILYYEVLFGIFLWTSLFNDIINLVYRPKWNKKKYYLNKIINLSNINLSSFYYSKNMILFYINKYSF